MEFNMSIIICVSLLLLNLIVLFIALTYTTKIKSLLEISELQSNNTLIRKEADVLEKINKIIQGGCDHLQIVTDFDLTLTADINESGKKVLNSYEMLRLCPSIPQSYKDEDTKLFLKYKHVEEDPNLSIEEKSKSMVEWYKASHNLLRGLKYPRDEMKNIAQNVSNSFRKQVSDLFNWCDVNDIPVLVLSSGLGDAVVASLEAANLLTRTVKVISNFLELNDDDIIIGMKGQPIHSHNKNEASIKNTDYYEKLQNRNNVILMGDSLGDANMTDGMDHCDTVLKIGFLSKRSQNNLQTYLNNFDIVLLNDQTMDVVLSITKLL